MEVQEEIENKRRRRRILVYVKWIDGYQAVSEDVIVPIQRWRQCGNPNNIIETYLRPPGGRSISDERDGHGPNNTTKV